MSKVVLEITMSLDGLVAGANISEAQPMGKNGESLHEWMFSGQSDDAEFLREMSNSTGAVILGNTTYRTAISDAWGGRNPFDAPAIVVCGAPPSETVEGFSYITGGIREALDKAKAISGGKNIWIMGGGSVAQQFLKEDLVDEIKLHITPILLGTGTKLFGENEMDLIRLDKVRVAETHNAVHMHFNVIRN